MVYACLQASEVAAEAATLCLAAGVYSDLRPMLSDLRPTILVRPFDRGRSGFTFNSSSRNGYFITGHNERQAYLFWLELNNFF